MIPLFRRRYIQRGGPLHPALVRWGRLGCACGLVAACLGPGLLLGAFLAPASPLLLLPVLCYPRDPVPKALAPLCAPAAAAAAWALTALWLPYVPSAQRRSRAPRTTLAESPLKDSQPSYSA